MTMQMGISRHDLATTTKKLVGANSSQIKLDGAVFMNPTMGNATSSQMMGLTPKVTCLFISQKARKELCAMHTNFPAQVSR